MTDEISGQFGMFHILPRLRVGLWSNGPRLRCCSLFAISKGPSKTQTVTLSDAEGDSFEILGVFGCFTQSYIFCPRPTLRTNRPKNNSRPPTRPYFCWRAEENLETTEKTAKIARKSSSFPSIATSVRYLRLLRNVAAPVYKKTGNIRQISPKFVHTCRNWSKIGYLRPTCFSNSKYGQLHISFPP